MWKTFAGLLCCLMLASCAVGLKPADRFEAIREMVCDGEYQAAIPKLKSYSGTNNSRAGLFLGKAYLGLGDIENAKAAFESTSKKFPKTVEAHKCQYKLALLSYFSGETESAKAQFERLANEPDGPLAAEARAFAEFLK